MSPDAIDGQDAVGPAAEAEHDQLPPELDASGFVGPTAFPDVRRRRVPGILYLLSVWLGYNQPDVAGHVHDYGTKFLVTAGLLNVLAMVDVYEIAAGKKN